MKNTNNKTILAASVIGTAALIVSTQLAASYVPATAIAIAYIAVAVLVALAATDYRAARKGYSAR